MIAPSRRIIGLRDGSDGAFRRYVLPVKMYLFDRQDLVRDPAELHMHLRLSQAYVWSTIRGLAVLGERLAIGKSAELEKPPELYATIERCRADDAGLLVWNLAAIGDFSVIRWCATELLGLPVVLGHEQRVLFGERGNDGTIHVRRYDLGPWVDDGGTLA